MRREVCTFDVLPVSRSDPPAKSVSCVKRDDIQVKHRQEITTARGEREETVGELRIQVSQAAERAKKFEAMACALELFIRMCIWNCSCHYCVV